MEVETTMRRSHFEVNVYSKRRPPNDRPLWWGPKFAPSGCHAEMHNRMLNTRPRTHSVSVSKINSCAVKLSLVVEHTRYNPSRKRQQSGWPPTGETAWKDANDNGRAPADDLSKAGCSWGCASALERNESQIESNFNKAGV